MYFHHSSSSPPSRTTRGSVVAVTTSRKPPPQISSGRRRGSSGEPSHPYVLADDKPDSPPCLPTPVRHIPGKIFLKGEGERGGGIGEREKAKASGEDAKTSDDCAKRHSDRLLRPPEGDNEEEEWRRDITMAMRGKRDIKEELLVIEKEKEREF